MKFKKHALFLVVLSMNGVFYSVAQAAYVTLVNKTGIPDSCLVINGIRPFAAFQSTAGYTSHQGILCDGKPCESFGVSIGDITKTNNLQINTTSCSSQFIPDCEPCAAHCIRWKCLEHNSDDVCIKSACVGPDSVGIGVPGNLKKVTYELTMNKDKRIVAKIVDQKALASEEEI